MKSKKLIFLVCLLLPIATLLVSCGSSKSSDPLPTNEQFSIEPVFGSWLYSVTPNRSDKSFCFYLYIPYDYDNLQANFPLLLFLQGWGHFGKVPNPDLLSAGPLRPLYVSDTKLDPDGRNNLNSLVKNSIIVYPMMPYYDKTYTDPLGWYKPETIDTIINYIMANYRVDTSRFYVAGLSEGGGGSWGYAWTYPSKVAAVIPVSCGLSWPANDGLKKMPTWIFHSYDDPQVPHQTSSDVAFNDLTGVTNVMQTYPGDGRDYTIGWSLGSGLGSWSLGTVYPTGLITYTIYASGGHDAWTRTFANNDVWKWLYAQTK